MQPATASLPHKAQSNEHDSNDKADELESIIRPDLGALAPRAATAIVGGESDSYGLRLGSAFRHYIMSTQEVGKALTMPPAK